MTKRKITKIEDITCRPRFKRSVDVTNDPLVDVLFYTHFKDKEPCGKQGCHQPHNEGGLIVLGSGNEILVGIDCAEKAFPGQFDRKRRELIARDNEDDMRLRLMEAQGQADGFISQVDDLNRSITPDGNAYQSVHFYKLKIFSDEQWAKLHRMSREGDNELKAKVSMSKEEREKAVEVAKATNSGPISNMETRYRVMGIKAVSTYTKLRQIDSGELKRRVELFRDSDVMALATDEVKIHSRWLTGLPNELKKLKDIQEECIRFTNSGNIDKIRANRHLLK